MFEQIFDQYRRAVDSSFEMRQEMYRQWMNGLPVKPADLAASGAPDQARDELRHYQERWSRTVAEALERHRAVLNEQYRQGVEAISSAFRTTEAKTPEEFWRLTQEFWRKAIDSYKKAFQTQTRYLQNLAGMWLELVTKGKV